MLIRPSELPGPPGGRSFVGADHGGVPISLFLVDVRPGSGPGLHRHPYPEIFVDRQRASRLSRSAIPASPRTPGTSSSRPPAPLTASRASARTSYA